MKTWILLTAVALGACASTQQTPAPAPQPVRTTAPVATAPTPKPTPAPAAVQSVDPVGAYEFSTVANGQTVTGTLYITGTPGAYTGRIVTNVFPEIPVTGAKAAGNAIDVTATMPDGDLGLHFVMDGDAFKGNWTLGPDTGEFNGKKLPKQ